MSKFPIGVFDSGYGGLTVLKEFVEELPDYDFIYLGDNARAPYGNRSFQTVYEYTLECVEHLFNMGCKLVILACNTASAKALRSIQQKDLQQFGAERRVLGVIRPTSEIAGQFTQTNHIGIFATPGTVISNSYIIEIEKFFPRVKVFQEACPMWVPIIENNEINSPSADYFVEQHIKNLLQKSDKIDTIILGCTHYPLLIPNIMKFIPTHIKIIEQGKIVAQALAEYLLRHPEMEMLCSKNRELKFYTTDAPDNFDENATQFFGKKIKSEFLQL